MNSGERVKKAISFQHPDRIPVLFFNRDKELGDMVMIDIQDHFGGPDGLTSEWGFHWERLDRTMGQPIDTLIHDWETDLPKLKAPELNPQWRMQWIEEQKSKAQPGQYLLGSLQLSGFTIMSFLRGFAEMMEDFYLEPEYMEQLADVVFDFELQLIEFAAKAGLHGIAFFDDWGTQNNLLISPKLWRSFFAPRYRKQFALAHSLGMDVYFHSCGNITELVSDFFEIGVDMLNLSQPNLYDIPQLGVRYGGKHCFVIPVSYQTTSLSGTKEEIFRDVKCAMDSFGRCGGGMIGYVEEYSSMGMTEENYWNCVDAFRQLGKYDV